MAYVETYVDSRLEENVKLVHHTAAERALYLGHAHDAPDLDSPDAFSAENIQAPQWKSMEIH